MNACAHMRKSSAHLHMRAMRPKPATRRPARFTIDIVRVWLSNSERLVARPNNCGNLRVNMRATHSRPERAIRREVGTTQWQLHAAFDVAIAHRAIAMALYGTSKQRGKESNEDEEIAGQILPNYK